MTHRKETPERRRKRVKRERVEMTLRALRESEVEWRWLAWRENGAGTLKMPYGLPRHQPFGYSIRRTWWANSARQCGKSRLVFSMSGMLPEMK